MRLNRFVALATGKSRRAADRLIAAQHVLVNDHTGQLGEEVSAGDTITLDGRRLVPVATVTILLNKPAGYVCSRRGQGSQTIYDLLPPELHHLKPVGRLDKDSSGLLLLTNDGALTQQLTHPSFQKEKVYEVALDKRLTAADVHQLKQGVTLTDGVSRLQLSGDGQPYIVTMQEGRNRQIRRTFAELGYAVTTLHRTQFGPYRLTGVAAGRYKTV